MDRNIVAPSRLLKNYSSFQKAQLKKRSWKLWQLTKERQLGQNHLLARLVLPKANMCHHLSGHFVLMSRSIITISIMYREEYRVSNATRKIYERVKQDQKVCGDGTLLQLLCFCILSVVLFLFKNTLKFLFETQRLIVDSVPVFR
jgi:hypothetical protein